ncbi:MAG TPA: mycofactocin biosynthesis glycosyltransferase MftF [Streptosporangiaceae bacterium]
MRKAVPPLPAGFGIELDAWTKQLTAELWFGGSPVRVARLTPAGQAAWSELRSGRVTSRATGSLARYFTDTGLAHPVPPELPARPDVTVIVPARDRTDLLERCLAALGDEHQVIVVDDASADPEAVALVTASHRAKLIRREINGGPGAARNTGLAAVTSDLVAFVDSDCEPSPDWIGRLAGHFADPLVAVAAPRITGRAEHTVAGRYTEANGALDLGGRPGRVMPKAAVSFVPTAAVLARRTALAEIAAGRCAFDEGMRVGEDVDLIWRLHEAGWRIRYDPSVQVAHHEPASWRELLARRYRYGTSAAALAQRHPGDIVHLALAPWPAATVAALLARRPVLAAAAFGGALATLGYRLRRAEVPRAGLTRATVMATRQTWLGVGRYGTQFAAPALIAAIAAPGRSLSRGESGGPARYTPRPPPGPKLWRRLALGSLLLGPPLTAWAEGSRTLDPVRFTVGRIADDIAYGAGVWSGCLARRTLHPLRPVIAWRSLRIDPRPLRPPATRAPDIRRAAVSSGSAIQPTESFLHEE